ncbi:hypothetical protein K492DRAFT_65271 [Lichtheimia hyalospora FSU 10163]|nr:hypothetical protein K492DRAFT_65271 [Lichtheimia hyalospora FSU 10163]
MTRSSPSSLHNGDTDDETTVAPTNTTTTTPPVTIDMECTHCNNSATFMCSSCGLAGPRYCSVDCQKIDWKLRHYKDCEATKAARRTRQAERAAQRGRYLYISFIIVITMYLYKNRIASTNVFRGYCIGRSQQYRHYNCC